MFFQNSLYSISPFLLRFYFCNYFFKSEFCLGQVVQLVGASPHTPKGCRFNSWSGHIPRLRVQSPVRAHTGDNQSMFLSHINVSLSLSLSHAHLLCLSQINKHLHVKMEKN